MFSAKSGLFGLEIGNYILRVASVHKGVFGYGIKAINEIPLSQSPLLKNGIRDKAEFTTQLKQLLEQSQPKPITQDECSVTLPESSVFSKVIAVPKVSHKELTQSVPFEAAEFLPLPLEEMYLDWQIDTEANTGDPKILHVLVVAVPKRLVDDLSEILGGLGIKMLYLENQPFSLARALQQYLAPKKVSMIVHIAHNSTTLILASSNAIKFIATISIGSDSLEKDSKYFRSLSDELTDNINYFHNRLEEKSPIDRVILAGQGALTKGLAEAVTKATKLPCEIGYPSLTLPNKEPIHPRFSTVLGVALREKVQ